MFWNFKGKIKMTTNDIWDPFILLKLKIVRLMNNTKKCNETYK